MNIINILAHNNYILINKSLMKIIGRDETILLGELASEYDYWMKLGKLDNEGYFYSTIDNIENNILFKSDKQRTLLNKLKNLDLIKIKLKDLPAKRFIALNIDAITKLTLGL